MPRKPLTIGVIGLWHLGTVYAVALAELGHTVIGFDTDASVVKKISDGILPVAEEGLDEMMRKNTKAGRLKFTDNLQKITSCDIVWVTIDTPCNTHNLPDISSIRQLIVSLVSHLKNGVSIIVSSQVPVGSGEELCSLIRKRHPTLRFSYSYQPENLQLGKALQSFLHPARIVAGVATKESEERISRIFANVDAPKLYMNIPSAEMVKHAVNAFLATSLSFMYDISDMCEAYGADVLRVSEALKSDTRIGRGAYLDSSIGFSGATLGRDLSALLDKSKRKKLTLPVIAGARIKNEKRWQMTLPILKKEIKDLSEATIGFLGVAYKPGTSTVRDSLSLKLMHELVPFAKEVRAHDYLVPKEEVLSAGPYRFCSDPYELAQGSSALILMTAWSEYSKLDFKKIGQNMKGPKLFFDAKNALWQEEEEIKAAGLQYVGIGRGRR